MNKFKDIVIRYSILILAALPNLYIFYLLFTPLTIYPVYFLLKPIFQTALNANVITINQVPIEIVRACVSGSAYYLLFILNLSTPNIKFNKRIKMIIISFASLLILNILRIFLLSIFLIENPLLFNITHMLFWYILSIAFVLGIWFAEVKYFKIKQIPFYSDLKFIYKNSSLRDGN